MGDDIDLDLQRAAALETLEAVLEGEQWFLDRVHAQIDAACDPNEALRIKQALNHDFLIHLTQFYFSLSALNCREPENIRSFIIAHNERVNEEMRTGVFSETEKKRIKRSIFKPEKREKVVDTCRELSAPVFSLSDIAHFMREFMSESSATRMVDDLTIAGLFRKATDARIEADQTRKLRRSTGMLESFYAASLLRTRRTLAADPAVAAARRDA